MRIVNDYMKSADFIKHYGISRTTLRRWLNDGLADYKDINNYPAVKRIGRNHGRLRISPVLVDEYFAKRNQS